MHDYKTIYRDIAPKDQIIAGGLAFVRGRVGAAGVVTLDALKEGCVEVVKSLAVEKLYPDFLSVVGDAVALYELLNGSRIDSVNENRAEAWRDDFDSALEQAIGTDLARAIGPSCMGEHFTDSDVDDEQVRNAVVREMCERLAEAAMPMDDSDPNNIKPSVNKTLSAAGIVKEDLIPYCNGVEAATDTPVATAATIDDTTARGRVEQVVGAWAIRTGLDNFDPLVLDEILVSAFDDDDFISLGGVERLGGAVADVAYFRTYGRAVPEAKQNTLDAAYLAAMTGEVIEAPKPPSGPKIKITGAAKSPTSRRGKAQQADPPPSAPPSPGAAVSLPTPTAAPGVSDDWGDVARIWRENATDTDSIIAEAFGVSRGTVSNIGMGKASRATAKPLSPAVRQKIAKILSEKADKLQDAANSLG